MYSLELSPPQIISEELEQVRSILDGFLETLQVDQDIAPSKTLMLSDLTLCPGMDLKARGDQPSPDLLQVYDQVVNHWMEDLPLAVSNSSRLSKFKIVRRLALELYLGCIGISLCDKVSQRDKLSVPETNDTSLLILSKSNESPLAELPSFSSPLATQDPSQDAGFSLPTSVRTPSSHSRGWGGSTADPIEEPAILRLRRYTDSIKAPANLGTSSLLSLWPVSAGADPTQYKWDAVQWSSAKFGQEEGSLRKRREDSRRQKRSKGFADGESTTTGRISSQPMPRRSERDLASAANSQRIHEGPMSQPDKGLFGSRSAHFGNKKQKKRRAAGF